MRIARFRGFQGTFAGCALLMVLASGTHAYAEDSGIGSNSQAGDQPTLVREFNQTSSVALIVRGQGKPIRAEGALAQDLAQFAKQRGLDEGSTFTKYSAVEAFTELVNALADELPASYVRAGVTPAGSSAHYWIQFTSTPPAAVLERISALPVDVRIDAGAPASALELSRVQQALADSLATAQDLFESSLLYYDPEVLAFRFEYAKRATIAAEKVDQALAASVAIAARASDDGTLPVPLMSDEHASLPESFVEATVQGGRNLRRLSSGDLECTGGFTAVRNGNRGMLTARHCADAITYQSSTGVISTNPATPDYAAVDLQFHRTLTENGHDTNKEFRATGTTEADDRVVLGIGNGVVGSPVCHWGMTSGYSCDEIDKVDVCRTLSGTQYCGLDLTVNYISAPGDSGGPWFLGQSARGTHSGGGSEGSLFTRISRVYQHLGATVLEN